LKILDSYILKGFIVRFIAVFIVLISLFIGIEIISKIWQLDAPGSTIALYYLFKLPSIAVQMLPVSLLIACLLLLSTLSSSNEIVAMHASGIGIFKIVRPLLVLICGFSLLTLWLGDYVIPVVNFKAKKIWMVEIMGKGGEFWDRMHKQKAWFRGDGLVYNIHNYNSEKKELQGVNLFFFNKNFKVTKHVFAKSATYIQKIDKWNFKDVKLTEHMSNKAPYPITSKYNELNFKLKETHEDFKKVESQSSFLSLVKLYDYIKNLKKIGIDTVKYELEFHKRFAMAFAGLIMTMLAIPFAVRQRRSGAGLSKNISLSFLFVFFYWILMSILISLGNSGKLNPILAAWGANLLFASSAIYNMKKNLK
jgi:lipopolysaccharide export system permease protein